MQLTNLPAGFEFQVRNKHFLEPGGKSKENRKDKFMFYAQNLILVNLILVNFGGFLIIARNAENGI